MLQEKLAATKGGIFGEVVSAKMAAAQRQITTLQAGTLVGEIALLNPGTYRNATVRE